MPESDHGLKPVTAKLAPPEVDEAFLRPETLAALEKGWASRLTLVCAPAGYGKTTAVAAACRTAQVLPIWYKLDVLDQDALAFLGSLTEAFRLSYPDFGQTIVERLRYSHESPVSVEQLAALFISECVEHVREPALVVFDDYHEAADSPELNRALDRLLAGAPDTVHFAVLSRYDPAFPIAKLRLSGQLTPIGIELLRFEREQAESVLEARTGRRCNSSDVERLVQLTEGWPASVVLAALALDWLDLSSLKQALDDPRMSQDIYSYLAEQVYRNENAETQHFLDQTCCLEHVTPALANRLIGADKAHEYLRHLAENRVFTFVCERGAYRYHNLFSEFLRHQYVYRHGEAAFRTLQVASAIALEEAGNVEMTLELLLAANELPTAIEVLGRVGEAGLDSLRTQSLVGWLQRLSLEARADEPWARLLSSQVHTRAGSMEEAVAAIDQAIAVFDSRRHAPGLYLAHSARAGVYFWVGDLNEYVATCERALEYAATDAQRFHTLVDLAAAAVDKRDWQTADATFVAADALRTSASTQDRIRSQAIRGLADLFQGEHRRALSSWPSAPSDAVSPSLRAGFLNIEASIHRTLADYDEAHTLLHAATEIATQYCPAVVNEMIRDSMGVLLCSSGAVGPGLELIRNAVVEMRRLHGYPILIALGLVGEACVLRRLGDNRGALSSLSRAEELVASRGDPYAALELAANMVFTRAVTDGSPGVGLLDIAEEAAGHRLSSVSLAARLFHGILLCEVNPRAAQDAFADCLPQQLRLGHLDLLAQEIAPRFGVAILALESLGDGHDRRELLRTLARHWRFAELFEHLATRQSHLSAAALSAAIDASTDTVLTDVLGMALRAGSSRHDPELARARAERPHCLPEQCSYVALPDLTAREREVLGLMAGGLRNQQIAERLFLSVPTVKTHVNHIFYKLGVTTRVEAVLRYQESSPRGAPNVTGESGKLNPGRPTNPARV